VKNLIIHIWHAFRVYSCIPLFPHWSILKTFNQQKTPITLLEPSKCSIKNLLARFVVKCWLITYLFCPFNNYIPPDNMNEKVHCQRSLSLRSAVFVVIDKILSVLNTREIKARKKLCSHEEIGLQSSFIFTSFESISYFAIKQISPRHLTFVWSFHEWVFFNTWID